MSPCSELRSFTLLSNAFVCGAQGRPGWSVHGPPGKRAPPHISKAGGAAAHLTGDVRRVALGEDIASRSEPVGRLHVVVVLGASPAARHDLLTDVWRRCCTGQEVRVRMRRCNLDRSPTSPARPQGRHCMPPSSHAPASPFRRPGGIAPTRHTMQALRPRTHLRHPPQGAVHNPSMPSDDVHR